MFASSFDYEHRQGDLHVDSDTDGIVAVCVQGDFDVANVSALRDQVDEALASGDDLILDLSEATFIDSSVIRVLFDAARTVRGREQNLVLQLGTAPIVERALTIAGIERVVPRAHDRDEALRMIRRERAAV
jgi:anti-sigma B factor antagonist/stage II sporulation protein AA (anti-sigma F factor antagonist)